MKKFLIYTLIAAACVFSFVSCNSEIGILREIQGSVVKTNIRMQNMVYAKKTEDNTTAFYISNKGFEMQTFGSDNKATKTILIPNEAGKYVNYAYMNSTSSATILFSTGEFVTYIIDTTNKKATAGTTESESYVYLSTKGEKYSTSQIKDFGSIFTEYGNDKDYQKVMFMVEADDGALILSNTKQWMFCKDGKLESPQALADIAKPAEVPILFKKVDDSNKYWVMTANYSYILKVNETTVTVDRENSSAFSGTRMVTFDNLNKVFVKYNSDTSVVYYFDKSATSIKDYKSTYSLPNTLQIVGTKKISENNWIVSTLESSLYIMNYTETNGTGKFTLTSIEVTN